MDGIVTPSDASDRVKVLYVIGWGRSGSTLIDTLLGAVPGFFSTGELRNIWKEGLQEERRCGCGRPVRDCAVWSSVLDDVTQKTGGLDVDAMVRVQREALRMRHAGSLIRSLYAGTLPPPHVAGYAEMQGRLYDAIARTTGARVVVDSSKVPTDAALLGSIDEVEPYLLHLVRDPRASAYSWQRAKARLDGRPSDTLPRFGLMKSSLNWAAFNAGAEALRRHPAFRSSLVRYEDFLVDPRQTISDIVRFTGEAADELPFETPSVANLAGNHTVSGNPSRFRTGRVEIRDDDEWRWRQPRAHARAVSALTAPMLPRYRYPVHVSSDAEQAERRHERALDARRHATPNGPARARLGRAIAPIGLAALPPEPLVSVLVTNHNYGHFIGDALESVMRQTYDRLEVVVCDDGSTDRSIEVIEDHMRRDDRIRLVAKRNGGQASAFNAAYRASCGEVICFLDADDMFLHDKVASVVRAFRDAPAGLLVHQLMIVDDVGKSLQRIPTFTRFEEGWIADRVIDRGGRWRWMPTSGVALRRELTDAIFPVPEEPFRIDADMFMLELAPLLAPVGSIDEVLGHYRLHGRNAFSRRGHDRRAVERTLTSIDTALEQANAKLDELALPQAKLDPERNLKLREQRFLIHAFDGASSRELWSEYAELARALVRDDLYSASQKAWAILLFLGVMVLPVGRRERWAGASLGVSRGKELVRRVQQSDPLARIVGSRRERSG